MWSILKDVIVIFLFVFILSQIVLPSVIPGLEYFNIFKKKKSTEVKSLEELDKKADQVQKVKQEIKSTEEKLTEIKNKTN